MIIDAPATHVRRRLARDLSRFGKTSFFVWALVSTGSYPRSPGEMALVYASSCVAVLGIAAILASDRFVKPKLRPARAKLEGRTLEIERRDGKRAVLDVDRDVASAHHVDNATELTTRDGDVWGFVHASTEEADAFTRALGFGTDGRRATYDLSLPVSLQHRVGLGFFATFAGAVGALLFAMITNLNDITLMNVMAVTLVAVVYELMRSRGRRPVVTVGVDGVEIAHRRRRRFVPASAIAGATKTESGHAVIVRRDAAPMEIVGPNEFRQAALAAHVRSLATQQAEPPPAALSREGRSVREWREHLRAAVVGGYRVASEPTDAIAAQLSSRAVTPEQRVGAALALRIGSDDGAVRVRVAAERCADPRLREALEAAAEHEIDDGKLERALSRLGK